MSIHVDPTPSGEKTEAPVFPFPDTAQLDRFRGSIFKNADGGWLLFRAFEHENQRAIFSKNASIHTGDPQLLAVVTERALQTAKHHKPAVFCPPTTTFKTGENAQTENIFNGLTLSAECDEAPQAASAKLTTLLGEPTMVVCSGGEWTCPKTGEVEPKLHLHWRLQSPTRSQHDHARLRQARLYMALLTGADHTNISTVHPIRWPGTWHTKNPSSPKLAHIVSETDNELDLDEALDTLEEEVGAAQYDRASGTSNSKGKSAFGDFFRRARDIKHVEMALDVIANEDLHWDGWTRIGLAIFGATGGSGEGLDLFHKWSAKSSKYDPAKTDTRWEGISKSPPDRIGMGTLWFLAEQQRPGSMTGKPIIHFSPDDVPAVAQRAEEVLLEAAEIYQRGGELVRPIIEDADAAHGRRTRVARLVKLTPIFLRNELDKVATWTRHDGRAKKAVRIGAPKDIAEEILSQAGR